MLRRDDTTGGVIAETVRLADDVPNSGRLLLSDRLAEAQTLVFAVTGVICITEKDPPSGRAQSIYTHGDHTALWYLDRYIFETAIRSRDANNVRRKRRGIFHAITDAYDAVVASVDLAVQDLKRAVSDKLLTISDRLVGGSCDDWYNQEIANPPDYESVLPSPCTLAQATRDPRFVADSACNMGMGSCDYFHRGAFHCVRSATPSATGASQQACYDLDGNLLAYGNGGGTFDKSHANGHDATGKWRLYDHIVDDVLPFLACCKLSRGRCAKYGDVRPTDDCDGYEEPRPAWTTGDPHVKTLDGKNYTFNPAGEFNILQVNSGQFRMQGRTEQYIQPATGVRSRGSVWTALVMQEASSSTVEVQASDRLGLVVLVDGQSVEFDDIPAQQYDGVHIYSDGNTLTVNFEGDVVIVVTEVASSLGFYTVLSPTAKGHTSGLLGVWNDNGDDDLQRPDGTTIPCNSSDAVIHYEFGVKWRITESMSMFTYPPGTSYSTFQDESFVPVFGLPPTDNATMAAARGICGDSVQCLYDFLVTGNVDLAIRTRHAQQEYDVIVEEVVPVVTCGFPTVPAQGSANTTNGPVGTSVVFVCDPGYTLNGSEVRVCQRDGTWSGEPTQCLQGPTTEIVTPTSLTTMQPGETQESTSATSSMYQSTTQDPVLQTSITQCYKTDRVSCDMETMPTTDVRCYWVQGCADDFDWTRMSGRTPSSRGVIGDARNPITGPEGAQDGTYYMYVEATGRQNMDMARMALRGSAFSASGNGCLQFYYNMNGFHIGTLNLFMKTNTQESLLWSMSGDQSHLWQHASIDVQLDVATEFIFEAVMKGEFSGDIAVDSIAIENEQCVEVETTIAPCNKPDLISCDMENMPTTNTDCNLMQECTDNIDWIRHSGRTPSADVQQFPITGPQQAQGGTNYMYVEATGTQNMDLARMTLRGSSFSVGGNGCLQFYYNMNGLHIGTLNLFMKTNTHESLLWSMSGDKSHMWEQASFDVQLDVATEYIFEAVMTGLYAGDIAVDSITVEPRRCTATVATFSCDMEQMPTSNSDCNLVQDYTDDFDWTRNSGRTLSSIVNPDRLINGILHPVTGPVGAQRGQYYIYVEATGRVRNDTTRIFLRGSSLEGRGKGCLHFYHFMNGRHIGSFNLYASNGTSEMKIWSMSGDQSPAWQQANIDIELGPIIQYVFEAVMIGLFAGDIAVDDISIEQQQCNQNIWSCQFEGADNTSSICSMEQDDGDQFDWTLWTGPTPSATTGPSAAYSGLYYIYTEVSDPRLSGDEARILTPPLAILPMETICVQFRYHMSGRHTGTLQLFTRSPDDIDTTQWMLQGPQPNEWLTQRVTIDQLTNSSMVGFAGDRASGFAGDIAIDDIVISHGSC